MRGGNSLVALLLLVAMCAASAAAKTTACSSKMPGDFKFSTCASFCKAEKSGNHCQYCKCKDCAFCGGASTSASAASTTKIVHASSHHTNSTRKHKKRETTTDDKKRETTTTDDKKRETTTDAMGTAAATAGSGSALKKCHTTLKGDFGYETCGAFCKANKSGNHCQFCKCKTCTFCGGSARPPAAMHSPGTSHAKSGHPRAPTGASQPKMGPGGDSKPAIKRHDAASAAAAPAAVGGRHGLNRGWFVIGFIVVGGVAIHLAAWVKMLPCFSFLHSVGTSESVGTRLERNADGYKITRDPSESQEGGGDNTELDAAFRNVEKLEKSLRG